MATAIARVFEDKPALRERTPLLIGLVGASGSGKTFSALRLAGGIQRVSGGDIYGIDTEARRMLHYADTFKFRHLEFSAPFGSLDYLAAIEHCVKKGAKTVIVDSTSHEHEGPGGVLESHQAEQERLAKQWNSTMDKVTMAAWQKPKSDRRRLLNSILQMPVNFIFCFRAKEKVKLDRGGKPIPLGWMPIAGEEFVYEMTLNMLLYPGSGGVPTWQPEESGEKAMIKLPSQFKAFFDKQLPLAEDLGERLAKWAAGVGPGQPTAFPVVRQSENMEAPPCPVCSVKMSFVEAGKKSTGEEFPAFWICPNKKRTGCQGNMRDSEWQEILRQAS
ncbi:MAG: AAA family ATPase [Candidatus Binatia bacterium]|nr:AAA family ATPase [Candidatus Binatia bacterium]